MRLQQFFAVLCAACVHGAPGIDLSKNPWKAPGPNDLRSPCPGLNTLANHGFLPRNGRGLTVAQILKAGLDGYNVHADTIALAAKIGLATTADYETFTLEDIKLHNTIEHDASISREDDAIGDNLHFNETTFQTLANSNPGVDYYNATSAGDVQRLRLADSVARNPEVINTLKEINIRTRESALYLSVMGDQTTGRAPKKFVDIFFREERLPIAEGWKRSATIITPDSLGPMSDIISEASKWSPDSKCASVVLVLDKDSVFII